MADGRPDNGFDAAKIARVHSRDLRSSDVSSARRETLTTVMRHTFPIFIATVVTALLAIAVAKMDHRRMALKREAAQVHEERAARAWQSAEREREASAIERTDAAKQPEPI